MNGTDPNGEFFDPFTLWLAWVFVANFARVYFETGDTGVALQQAAKATASGGLEAYFGGFVKLPDPGRSPGWGVSSSFQNQGVPPKEDQEKSPAGPPQVSAQQALQNAVDSAQGAGNPEDVSGVYRRAVDSSLGRNEEIAVTPEFFAQGAEGKTLQELQTEVPGSSWFPNSLGAGGPANRYVVDPATANRVVDMRHFLVVGARNRGFGIAVETAQAIALQESAFNLQDLRSNELGFQFFNSRFYDPMRPTEIGNQVRDFFSARRSTP